MLKRCLVACLAAIALSAQSGTIVVKTANYTLLSGDKGTEFVFNGSSLTATLPSSPPTMPWIVGIHNINSTALTIARNGNTINGVAANITLYLGQSATCASDTATGGNYVCDNPNLSGALSLDASSATFTNSTSAYFEAVSASGGTAGFDIPTANASSSGVYATFDNNDVNLYSASGGMLTLGADYSLVSADGVGEYTFTRSWFLWPGGSSDLSYASFTTGNNPLDGSDQNQMNLILNSRVDATTKYYNPNILFCADNASATPPTACSYSIVSEGNYPGLVLTTTGSAGNASPTLTVASATGVIPGQIIAGTNIASGSQVLSVSGLVVTMNKNTTGIVTGGTTVTFSGFSLYRFGIWDQVNEQSVFAIDSNAPNAFLFGTNIDVQAQKDLYVLGNFYQEGSGQLRPGSGGLADSNGKTFLTDTATSSAVDYFNIVNGAAGSPGVVNLQGLGTDTNINIEIQPKGSGIVTTPGTLQASQYETLLNTVTFSATPTFNLSLGAIQKITLTGNVTSSSISNAQSNSWFTMHICQDATGSRTFAWPGSFKGTMTIGSTASKCSIQNFWYDGTNAWALSAGATNQ